MSTVAKIAVGVVMIYTGVGALQGASELGTVFAGAEIAGGAMTVYGAATHNDKMANTGMIIGSVGSMGTAFTAAGASSQLAGAGTTTTTGGDALTLSVDTNLSAANAAAAGTTTAGAATGAAGTTAAAGTAAGTGATAGTTATEAVAKTSAVQDLMKYSLISGAVSGAGNAYAARTNSDIQAQAEANKLEFEKSMANRANSYGIVPIGFGPAPSGLLTSPSQVAAPTVLAPTLVQPQA